jgi:hypothetical protein
MVRQEGKSGRLFIAFVGRLKIVKSVKLANPELDESRDLMSTRRAYDRSFCRDSFPIPGERGTNIFCLSEIMTALCILSRLRGDISKSQRLKPCIAGSMWIGRISRLLKAVSNPLCAEVLA